MLLVNHPQEELLDREQVWIVGWDGLKAIIDPIGTLLELLL